MWKSNIVLGFTSERIWPKAWRWVWMNRVAVMVFVFLTAYPISGRLALAQTTVFINELHYDNAGGDTGEGVEIAGPAGTDLTGWKVFLYNGSNNATYGTITLSGTIPDLCKGFGVLEFYKSSIQNGAPDGLALVDAGGNVLQFLSYEGTMTAISGPAAGLTTTDIGVAESGATPVGHSLQLTGSGTAYEDFTWSAAAPNTFGACNTNQTLTPPVCAITDLTAGSQSACDPQTNTYTQEIVVTFENPPASGSLLVNGQMFGIGVSPQTVTLMGLLADGISVDVTASFTADAACTYTVENLFTAPADCRPVDCAGVPGGESQIDECGECRLPTDPDFDQCPPPADFISLLNAILDEIDQLLAEDSLSERARDNLEEARNKLHNAISKFEADKIKSTFDKLRSAMKDLLQAQNRGAEVDWLIEELVAAARQLALDEIEKAQQFAGDRTVDKWIRKAQSRLNRAEKKLQRNRPDRAIQEYKAAWKYATKAYHRGNSGNLATEPFGETLEAVVGTTLERPSDFALEQNYPNPFNPTTTIIFSVPETQEITLSIYNLRGQLIATLFSEFAAAGRHQVTWNGANNFGERVASGIYLYRIEAQDFIAQRKLLLIK
ncbi:MAG: T9SS type A sorting domain-containing protein [bacterium]